VGNYPLAELDAELDAVAVRYDDPVALAKLERAACMSEMAADPTDALARLPAAASAARR
jgi:hypothetical protein